MAKTLTRVIRCAKRKKAQVKDKGLKKSTGYDTSFRATGYRPESKAAQNARHNR